MNRFIKDTYSSITNKADSSARPVNFSQKGFTIVELLIVLAMLGGVLAAVFSLYNQQRKVSTIEEDVVDVQQYLRLGTDHIVKDLRMAGFMIAGPVNPINAVSNGTGMSGSDTITLNVPSASMTHARVDVSITTNLFTTTPVVFTVGSAEEVDMFSVSDVVRILNSEERAQPVNMNFTVTATDRTVPSITLLPGATATDVLFERGHMIAKTGDAAPDTYPNTVEYCLGPSVGCAPAVTTCMTGQCLMRISNATPGNDDVVAENIQDVQFKYILDGSSSEADTTATLESVRAIRLTLTARNYGTEVLAGTAKTRELTSVVKIRNR